MSRPTSVPSIPRPSGVPSVPRPAGARSIGSRSRPAPGPPGRRLRPAARRTGVLLTALLATAAAAPAAGAAPTAGTAPAASLRALTTIDVPLLAQAGPDPQADAGTLAATATGDGHAAWVVVSGIPVAPAVAIDAPDATAAVWTLRDGRPTHVADVPVTGVLRGLELGTAHDGTPVLAVDTWGPSAAAAHELRLVNLDTGAVRTLSSTRRGLVVDSVAIDAGRLYSVVHPAKVGARNTSSLWRATLTGTSVGRQAKLRTSVRGETWFGVQADRGRVAVDTSTTPRDAPSSVFARDEIAFGTPSGRWTRTGESFATDGGYRPVTVLGFTQDRRAIVTAQAQESGAPIATRTPVGHGTVARVRLGATATGALQSPSYDPATNRILAFGPDPQGAAAVGWTAAAFR